MVGAMRKAEPGWLTLPSYEHDQNLIGFCIEAELLSQTFQPNPSQPASYNQALNL